MLGIAVLVVVLAGCLSVLWSAMTLGIGPVPTSRAVRSVMLELTPADATGTVYELGSGWGGLARALARRCPKAQVIAVEASRVPWAFSALLQRVRPLPNLRIVRGDFFEQPLADADVLVCYLFTGGMQKLAERVKLKSGAVLVSSTFALPGRVADDTVRASDLYSSPVYRYRG